MADNPRTAVLDNFIRPDEATLSYGGRYGVINNSWLAPRVVSNTLRPDTISDLNGRYWRPQQFTNFEVFCTYAGGGSIGTTPLRLWGRLKDVPGTSTYDGYMLQNQGTGSLQLFVVTNNVNTSLGSLSAGVAIGAGSTIGFFGIGPQLRAYHVDSSGEIYYTPSIIDSLYTSGFIGVGFGSGASQVTLSAFGGGEIIEPNIAPPMAGRARW